MLLSHLDSIFFVFIFSLDTLLWLLDFLISNVFSFSVLTVREKDTFERNYTVEHQIGSGGFGTVYAGTRRKDHKQVAIKHISKDKVTEWNKVSTNVNSYFFVKFNLL